MKKIWLLVLAVLTLSGCISSNFHEQYKIYQEDYQNYQFIEYLNNSTVVLQKSVGLSNLPRTYCTGVWVSNTEILTARHCAVNIEDDTLEDKVIYQRTIGTNIWYRSYQEVNNIGAHYPELPNPFPPHDSKVLAIDFDNDIAILTTTTPPKHEVVEIYSGTVWAGSKVHVIGHNSGLTYTYSSGYVSGTRRVKMDMTSPYIEAMQFSVFSYFGNSGGGVFDSQGRLIAICSFISHQGAAGVMFGIPNSVINKFLQKNHLFK